jgi:alpha-galactosidase
VYDFVCLQNEVISSVQGELKETVESQVCKMYVLTPK